MPDTGEGSTPAWRRYLRFWGSDLRADIDEEIAFHVDALTEIHERDGLAPADARRRALERFGDTRRAAHHMHQLARRGENAMTRSDRLAALDRDVRYGIRQLRKRPAFAAIAILMLALGIGANTAIFSAVDAVLLRPLHVPALERIVVVQDNLPKLGLHGTELGPGEARDLMQRADLFEASAGLAAWNPTLTDAGEPRRLAAARTIGRFFDVFGQRPFLGRFPRPEESEGGQHRVAVLSHGLWREMGADSGIVGRALTLNGARYQVVGVAAPEMRYPRSAELWAPFPVTATTFDDTRRMSLFMGFVARVRPDVGIEALRARLLEEGDRWRQRLPNVYGDEGGVFMTATPLATLMAGDLQPVLLALSGAVAMVLLIACSNIASLQLVHGASRARELAVRAALGAARSAIVRQLLVENLVLAVAGGLLGVLVARALLDLAIHRAAVQLPALAAAELNGWALLVTIAATVVAALAFGLLPSWRAGKMDLQAALKDAGRGSHGLERHRLLQGSVVVQIALTLVLLVGAGLLGRSLLGLLRQDPGFRPQSVTTARVSVAGERYAEGARITEFYRTVADRLRATPGVEAAGFVSSLPFGGGTDSSPFTILDRPRQPDEPERHANLVIVGGEYFRAMGIPLLRGREFSSQDAKDGPIAAIVDEQLARQYFGDEDPIGKRINQGPDAVIVGVVGAVAQHQLGDPAKATVYYHHAQYDWVASHFLTVRSTLPSSAVARLMAAAVRDVDAAVPLFEVRAMPERVADSLATRRLAMRVIAGFGILSLVLAVFGLYGVIGYAVSQRAREFGIRMALGARPSQVRSMVVRQGTRLAIAGVVLGIALAFVATRPLQGLLFGIGATDLATFALAAVVLAVVAVAASLAPARRATRVDPARTLRES